MSLIRYYSVLYVIVAIISFGHAYSVTFKSEPLDDKKLLGSFGCAIAWPLYWSVLVSRGVQAK